LFAPGEHEQNQHEGGEAENATDKQEDKSNGLTVERDEGTAIRRGLRGDAAMAMGRNCHRRSGDYRCQAGSGWENIDGYLGLQRVITISGDNSSGEQSEVERWWKVKCAHDRAVFI